MKVSTIIGTRPEIIRLSRVIAALERYMDHQLIHTGQNFDYEMNQIFFEELGIRKPQYFLEVAGQNAGETIGRIIDRSYQVLVQEKPDAVLILGDTNSCLAALCQETADPCIPYGSRKPLFRPTRSRGNQSKDRRPYQ